MKTQFSLIFKEEAKLDISEAYVWYEKQQTNLGERFLGCLDKVTTAIRKTPKGFKQTGNYRQCPLVKFPFVLVYEVIERTVVVYALFHTSQDPMKKPD